MCEGERQRKSIGKWIKTKKVEIRKTDNIFKCAYQECTGLSNERKMKRKKHAQIERKLNYTIKIPIMITIAIIVIIIITTIMITTIMIIMKIIMMMMMITMMLLTKLLTITVMKIIMIMIRVTSTNTIIIKI